MTKKMILALTSRAGLIAMSVLFGLLMLQGAWDILEDIGAIGQHQHAMEEILEGLGTILVAYGVALEERETLLKFLGVYPDAHTPQQARVDHHCHGYGLSLLLLGLFAEVSVYLIRMPDINTADFDPALIVFATLLCLVGAVHLGQLSWLLWRDPELAKATA
ncbi:MAG: hypothetical protein AB9900_04160 [Humidesulfovibrio sp.]